MSEQRLIGLSMHFTKASVRDGKMRWAATCSDTSEDQLGDTATLELFKNFVRRGNSGGARPYLSIAHYFESNVPTELKSKLGERGVPGWVEQLYIDGNLLKAKGHFEDTDLGRATHSTIKKDISENVPFEQRSRISIGFIDFRHTHGNNFVFVRKSLTEECPLCKRGIGNRKFIDGELIHCAVTRVPVNPRTPIEVEMGDEIETIQEDAASVVGPELAAALAEVNATAVEQRSTANVVTRSEADDLADLVTDRVITALEARLTPPVSAPPSEDLNTSGYGENDEVGAAVRALRKSLPTLRDMGQFDELLTNFGTQLRSIVAKSVPAPQISQTDVQIGQLINAVNVMANSITELGQRVDTVTAVINRSASVGAMGGAPVRMPQIVQNPMASQTSQNQQAGGNSNPLTAWARQSVGLPPQ